MYSLGCNLDGTAVVGHVARERNAERGRLRHGRARQPQRGLGDTAGAGGLIAPRGLVMLNLLCQRGHQNGLLPRLRRPTTVKLLRQTIPDAATTRRWMNTIPPGFLDVSVSADGRDTLRASNDSLAERQTREGKNTGADPFALHLEGR